MNVYHGSYTAIEEIDLSKSIPNKDFGKGFYVTKFRNHAESWAKVIGRKHKTQGFVTEFIFYDTEFTERLCKKFFKMVQDTNFPPVLEQLGVKNNYAFVKNMTVSILENKIILSGGTGT